MKVAIFSPQPGLGPDCERCQQFKALRHPGDDSSVSLTEASGGWLTLSERATGGSCPITGVSYLSRFPGKEACANIQTLYSETFPPWMSGPDRELMAQLRHVHPDRGWMDGWMDGWVPQPDSSTPPTAVPNGKTKNI